MDYLQYLYLSNLNPGFVSSFKPYYKWITFNINNAAKIPCILFQVLNLIINGLPSILRRAVMSKLYIFSFKPYYKWITFNIK